MKKCLCGANLYKGEIMCDECKEDLESSSDLIFDTYYDEKTKNECIQCSASVLPGDQICESCKTK